MENLPSLGQHYSYSGRIYKVVSVSSGTDEVLLQDIADGVRYTVRYAVFPWAYEPVWKIGDVASFVNRKPRSIYRYEQNGSIRKPKRYVTKGGREIRFYTKEDVLEIHELLSYIHQGRPRKDTRVVNNTLPDRASLLRMFRERYG